MVSSPLPLSGASCARPPNKDRILGYDWVYCRSHRFRCQCSSAAFFLLSCRPPVRFPRCGCAFGRFSERRAIKGSCRRCQPYKEGLRGFPSPPLILAAIEEPYYRQPPPRRAIIGQRCPTNGGCSLCIGKMRVVNRLGEADECPAGIGGPDCFIKRAGRGVLRDLDRLAAGAAESGVFR